MVRSSIFHPICVCAGTQTLRSFLCFEVVEGIGLGKLLQQSIRKRPIYQARPILRDLFCQLCMFVCLEMDNLVWGRQNYIYSNTVLQWK